ncbi:hypothetical protein A3860_36335 [Niastella vici]|uniref:Uncharacterized protein n=1 Tax=Niastella vici TaxID=1703345 RepID=A0A1V9FN37_9BACT|nr:hypothetical protein [Niastella vici]OQP59750.1 hypothetical protein A3860_36335 [Niastella vici]
MDNGKDPKYITEKGTAIRLMRGTIFLIWATMLSCNDDNCNESSQASGVITILLEQGFVTDSIAISYNDRIFFSSRITTSPSSGVASDFMGLNYDLSRNDQLAIYFNGKTRSYSLKEYSCRKSLIIKKQGNHIQLSGTNKTLDYQ